MDIAVHGKQVDVGAALRQHVVDRLNDINEKYFEIATNANVTFSRVGHSNGRGDFNVHIFILVGKNISINSDAKDADPYAAFEKAMDKASKRWRRYKRKVKDDHRKSQANALKAQNYVLSNLHEDEENEEDDASLEQAVEPVIVAESATQIDSLSVADAVARMDLEGNGALLFKNAGHGGLNMVYRRGDGNVGWIDPKPQGKTDCCSDEGSTKTKCDCN